MCQAPDRKAGFQVMKGQLEMEQCRTACQSPCLQTGPARRVCHRPLELILRPHSSLVSSSVAWVAVWKLSGDSASDPIPGVEE